MWNETLKKVDPVKTPNIQNIQGQALPCAHSV